MPFQFWAQVTSEIHCGQPGGEAFLAGFEVVAGFIVPKIHVEKILPTFSPQRDDVGFTGGAASTLNILCPLPIGKIATLTQGR